MEVCSLPWCISYVWLSADSPRQDTASCERCPSLVVLLLPEVTVERCSTVSSLMCSESSRHWTTRVCVFCLIMSLRKIRTHVQRYGMSAVWIYFLVVRLGWLTPARQLWNKAIFCVLQFLNTCQSIKSCFLPIISACRSHIKIYTTWKCFPMRVDHI